MFICSIYLTDYPKIHDLTVTHNSTTAVFTCNFTGHPAPKVMWYTPSGVIAVADGTTLTVMELGSEAAGIYQCFITNDIGCDRREFELSLPINYITENSSSIISTPVHSTVIDTSSVGIASSTAASRNILVVTNFMLSPTPSNSSVVTTTLPTSTGLLLFEVCHISNAFARVSFH